MTDSQDQQIKTGDDLAQDALNQASDDQTAASTATATSATDEVMASDQLATTLTALQNLIERNANELIRVSNELKHKRESLKNIFDNDTQLKEAEEQVSTQLQELKAAKARVQTHPEVTAIKVEIGELNEERKEIEETLSSHLVNYHQLTNSTSFDTSEGDQWEFAIKAKIKNKK